MATNCIDKTTIKAIIEAGAKLTTIKEGKSVFSVLEFDAGTPAHQEYVKAVADQDPTVWAIWGPGARGVIPPAAQQGPILLEANSIADAYQHLLAAAFVGGAVPPVAMLAALPAAFPVYRHAQLACTKVVERIQQPGAGFPMINGLGGGTFICHLHLQHANCAAVIAIYKV